MSRALTDPLPLRTTADIGHYTERAVLPLVYGQVVLSPVPYDGSRRLWLLADHPIQGVDRVELEGREISSWAVQQATDPTGRPVAVLETQAQVESASDLRVTLRGAVHPVSGALIDRPDTVLWHLLSSVAGMSIAAGRLDDLRYTCAGRRIAGVIAEPVSVQGALDLVCQGAGLAWSWESEALAMDWPPILGEPRATITPRESPRISASCDARAVVTRLELAYAYDWAAGDFRHSLTLRAPVPEAIHGTHLLRLEAPWIPSSRDALAYAIRALQWHARAVWTVSASAPRQDIALGHAVAIQHPHCPLSAGVLTTRGIRDAGESWTITGALGAAPDVELIGTAGAVAADALAGPIYDYQDGLATWLITDDAGQPLPGAQVTLDGGVRRMSDSQGYVQFQGVASGPHTLLVQPAGGQTFAPRTIAVTIA